MNSAYLFSLSDKPSNENWETLTVNGLAEWSDHVPALFLLLMGDDPVRWAWPAYDDDNYPPAFLCPHDAAAWRLQDLIGLVSAADSPRYQALLAALNDVAATLAAQAQSYVLLHFSTVTYPLFGRKYTSKGFKRYVETLLDEARQLSREFATAATTGCLDDKLPILNKLLEHPQSELGYWAAEVIDGYWQDLTYQPDELPAFLAKYDGYWYNDDESAVGYDGRLEAYVVRQRIVGQATREGVVTPYGRWLVPLGAARITTNKYDGKGLRSWITLSLDISPAGAEGADGDTLYGLRDANGVEVLPMNYESLYVVSDHLAFVRLAGEDAEERPLHIVQLDSMTVLPGEFTSEIFSNREDGYIEAERFGKKGKPGRGLLDAHGNTVAAFEFDGFSEFNKRTKLASVRRNGKVGLINQRGEVVLPIKYDAIAVKSGDVPHFFGDRTLIFSFDRDVDGDQIDRRVGIADKSGQVIVPPTMHCWHLQYVFDRNGEVMVYEDDTMYSLRADGTLSGPIGSRQATINYISAELNKKRRPHPEAAVVDAASLAAQLDRVSFDEFLSILCRDNEAAYAAVRQIAADLIDHCLNEAPEDAEAEDSDEEENGVSIHVVSGESPSMAFFRELRWSLRNEQALMHLDWKAVDELVQAQFHLPDIAALANFSWDGVAEGEDMTDGFLALDEFLSPRGYRVVSCSTDGDYYLIGVIAAGRVERFLELVDALQLPVRLVGEPDSELFA